MPALAELESHYEVTPTLAVAADRERGVFIVEKTPEGERAIKVPIAYLAEFELGLKMARDWMEE